MLKDPAIELRVPVRTGGKNAARKREGRRIELKDRHVGKAVVVGVKEFVVEDASRLAALLFAEHPFAIEVLIGLCWFAFDDVAQLFLPAIGRGQVELIEHEERERASREAMTSTGTIMR